MKCFLEKLNEHPSISFVYLLAHQRNQLGCGKVASWDHRCVPSPDKSIAWEAVSIQAKLQQILPGICHEVRATPRDVERPCSYLSMPSMESWWL